MRIPRPSPGNRPRRPRGYALLDVILAVTVFSFWGVGLVTLLQKISETSNSHSRDRLIQYQLESLLTEMKRRPVADMNQERRDEALEVTFRTSVEPLQLANASGDPLADLYEITAAAVFLDAGGEQTETARLIVYKPEEAR